MLFVKLQFRASILKIQLNQTKNKHRWGYVTYAYMLRVPLGVGGFGGWSSLPSFVLKTNHRRIIKQGMQKNNIKKTEKISYAELVEIIHNTEHYQCL